jgi:hypothetical protein
MKKPVELTDEQLAEVSFALEERIAFLKARIADPEGCVTSSRQWVVDWLVDAEEAYRIVEAAR